MVVEFEHWRELIQNPPWAIPELAPSTFFPHSLSLHKTFKCHPKIFPAFHMAAFRELPNQNTAGISRILIWYTYIALTSMSYIQLTRVFQIFLPQQQ
jgi:hypothetical protein